MLGILFAWLIHQTGFQQVCSRKKMRMRKVEKEPEGGGNQSKWIPFEVADGILNHLLLSSTKSQKSCITTAFITQGTIPLPELFSARMNKTVSLDQLHGPSFGCSSDIRLCLASLKTASETSPVSFTTLKALCLSCFMQHSLPTT